MYSAMNDKVIDKVQLQIEEINDRLIKNKEENFLERITTNWEVFHRWLTKRMNEQSKRFKDYGIRRY